MKAAGKVVVVTGAGNGMGREVTLELLRRGAKAVVAIDVNQDFLNETVQLAGEHGSKISTHVVDITDRAQVEALPAAVASAHGQVDGLINVAGIIHPFKPVGELSFELIERVFNVNFTGTLNMIKAFLPALLARPEAQITNISSMGSYVPVPGQTAYGASKGALNLLTDGMRSELADTSVGVNKVFPGAIGTNIAGNSHAFTEEQMKAMASRASKVKVLAPAVAGSIIVDAFESNVFQAFAGSDAKFMWRLSRFAPVKAANIIRKNMAGLI